ncbi:hypothetical protein VTK56DRAFT_1852 [Thermocarpiscus australiensis]
MVGVSEGGRGKTGYSKAGIRRNGRDGRTEQGVRGACLPREVARGLRYPRIHTLFPPLSVLTRSAAAALGGFSWWNTRSVFVFLSHVLGTCGWGMHLAAWTASGSSGYLGRNMCCLPFWGLYGYDVRAYPKCPRSSPPPSALFDPDPRLLLFGQTISTFLSLHLPHTCLSYVLMLPNSMLIYQEGYLVCLGSVSLSFFSFWIV